MTTFSVSREQRKVILYMLANACTATIALLIGQAFPTHRVLIILILMPMFSLVLVPVWPKRWTYAPETSYDSLYEGWRNRLPKAARIAVRTASLAIGSLALVLLASMIYTEFVRPGRL